MLTIKTILSKIQIGTIVEFIINLLTLGKGELLALFVAKRFFNSNSCGCCERKQWLNRLTNKGYDGKCNQINLF
jgi:hypothetical protein